MRLELRRALFHAGHPSVSASVVNVMIAMMIIMPRKRVVKATGLVMVMLRGRDLQSFYLGQSDRPQVAGVRFTVLVGVAMRVSISVATLTCP